MLQPAWWQELIGDPQGTAATPETPAHCTPQPLLVAYATQNGLAEDLAFATHEQLRAAGIASRALEFGELDLATLQGADRVLFLASTTCDGDPPDMAETFSREAMAQPASLAHLHYGLLALGDRGYGNFCGFGRTLDEWLRASGAQPWFPRIEVDDEDAAALDRWHTQVAALAAAVAA